MPASDRQARTGSRTGLRLAAALAVAAVAGVLALAQADPKAAAPAAVADKAAPATPARKITVELVSSFESGKPVSDLEEIVPITETICDKTGSRTITLGERAVLWVRNAHVDGKFFFERYYQEKYIGREARLEIDAAALAPGAHVIEPGHHVFTVAANGSLASKDPDLKIEGDRLRLRLYPVTVYAVDGAQTGPADFRKVATDLGVFALSPTHKLNPAALPNPAQTFDPQKPGPTNSIPPPLTTLLSHQKSFFPLTLWLPANQAGQGYVLYPSWQTFQLAPGGKIELSAGGSPRVPGVELDGAGILIPHRKFAGRISTLAGLASGVGNVSLAADMQLSATIEPLKFRAGVQKPEDDFFLPVDSNFTRQPFKSFVADNTTTNRAAIRLLALEWEQPVVTRGAEVTVGLRFLQSTNLPAIAQPEARVQYSPYDPALPTSRTWQALSVLGWQNGRDRGELKFKAPDTGFGFAAFRVQVLEKGDPQPVSALSAEILGAVAEPNQQGTATFFANKGRTAFAAGEAIDLQLVLRSKAARPAGKRTVVLTHPDGREETLAVSDGGTPWQARSLLINPARSASLTPGRYRLAVRDLPAGIVSLPWTFDLAGRDRASLFHVVKPSKYTRAMNNLEDSHYQGGPEDLERAMRTLADLGYNRVDLMTYNTNHHLRRYTWREALAAADPRLPPPEAVYAPSPRDQILNGCVREHLQYSDVWLNYNDFALPRYIEPYIAASERWMAREIQAMRHSPALDGMMLYDEMYSKPATGIVELHQNLFPRIRAKLATDTLGKSPSQVEAAFAKYRQRPRDQRDPEILRLMQRYADWDQHGWADYVNRVVDVGRSLAPAARFGTYHRTWAAPGANDDTYNGYTPDLFKNLDIISHVHYADNSTCWVSIPMIAQLLRTGTNKTLYVNIPLTHEIRTEFDGQYQRQMAFALLAQGANGISQWGLQHSFADEANPQTLQGRETTRYLNREILQPFGEIIDRTRDSYRRVGIVSTLNQQSLAPYKDIPFASQTEGIWIACWRLGYPARFIREETCQEKLEGYSVIFVPGIRFQDELDETVVKRLREALAAGTRVVVEQDSMLDLPGITRLADQLFDSYYVGTYFPTWLDDELKKVYQKSQPIVDYLGPKFRAWDVEPAARGSFTVGPTWRDGGGINYLIMANFEDPAYRHAVKQQMARPVLMPLQVPAHYGPVAYDLIAQSELPMQAGQDEKGRPLTGLSLDMRRVQGALTAFLPERIGKLQVRYAASAAPSRLRLTASLVGMSGKPIPGVFPTRITLATAGRTNTLFRVLGGDVSAEIDLPQALDARTIAIEVREAIAGHVARFTVPVPALAGPSLQATPDTPAVPHPGEVKRFIAQLKKAVIVPAPGIAGADGVARDLAAALKAKGVEARVVEEPSAYRVPTEGDPALEDPMMDGFHSWRKGQEIIGPALRIDDPVILLGGRGSSFLVDSLAAYGYLSIAPAGGPGLPVQPTLQVASRGLHFKFDTLCLLANDVPGLKAAVEQLFEEIPPAPAPLPAPAYGAVQTTVNAETNAATPALAFTDTNEMIKDIRFDKDGNAYAITWGHGKNLYSFAPDGKPRFSLFLPEMGANRLQVAKDRVLVHTAAGARVYQVGLDGKPISQVRLNMDPGETWDDEYGLAWTDFEYLEDRGWLLHKAGDTMRAVAADGAIAAQWRGEEFFDKDVADSVFRRELGSYALSPDGQRIAQVECSFYFSKNAYEDIKIYDAHIVIRDMTGKLLAQYQELDNFKGGWDAVWPRLTWPQGAPGPVAYARGQRWIFDAGLQILERRPFAASYAVFDDERRLVRDGRTLHYYDTIDHLQCSIGPFAIMPTLTEMSTNHQLIATLDEYGLLRLFRTADGAQQASWQVPELGHVLRFTPDARRLLLGTSRGKILAFDLAGPAPAWQARLGQWNDILDQNLPLYDPSFPDLTLKLWPVTRETPGELDALTRMAPNTIVNGDAETDAGWQGGAAYAPGGHAGNRALRVGAGAGTVSQEVNRYLGQHITWVLEFFYKNSSTNAARLIAGVLADSDYPDSVALHFDAGADWRYGRVVMKSGANAKRMVAGFTSEGGDVLVDDVLFRRIRFPSINHVISEPLHAIKPVILDNPLYADKYDPAGNLREQAPNRIIIEALRTGALNLVEPAFMQNGRLNDVPGNWYIQPVGHDPLVSVGLKEPRWISMVGLYFNAYDPDNIMPHFDIFATDMLTQKEILVASVRHNGELFRLVKFPPVKTPLIRIRPVNSVARFRTLTELELYGPLSGREGEPGFIDPEGQNAYMGDFSRVDKRPMPLAATNQAPISHNMGYLPDTAWNLPTAQVLAGDDRFYVARSFGKNTAYAMAKPGEELGIGRAGGYGYSPYGAFYGGLLLRNGLDGRLYCINPESGTALWTVRLGNRLFGSPVAIREDIFVANESNRLFQVDLANGSIIKDTELPAGVEGSLATDGSRLYFITTDGFLRAFNAADFRETWKTAVAPFSDSTPAVDGGVVYLADQKGTAMAIDAGSGQPRWQTPLNDEFARCPVVTSNAVVFGCRSGTLTALNRQNGQVVWTKKAVTRFTYEPLPVGDQVLYVDKGIATLAALADGAETRLQWLGKGPGDAAPVLHDFAIGDPAFSLSYYKGNLFAIPREDHDGLQVNYGWHHLGGRFILLQPQPPPAPPVEGKK